MTNGILEAEITNMDTGEVTKHEFYLFHSGVQMETIVNIINVEVYDLPGDTPFQVHADCRALDSIGGVFKAAMDFALKTPEEKDEILNDIKVDAIFIIKGDYYILKDGNVMLSDPDYRSIEPEFSEQEIREAFRFNSKDEHN